MLILAVSATVVSGMLCSWIACSWAWKDKWNGWSLFSVVATLSASLGILFISAPTGVSPLDVCQWLLSGPVNVVAAQGVVVLAVLAIWRWEVNRGWNPGAITAARR